MRVINKYRLELRWQKVEYNQDNEASLVEAYFTGPVLKEAAKIRENDQLTLDMTSQHSIFIPDYYQSVLMWKSVEYVPGKVLLKGATLKGKYVNSIDTLKNTDWILIDCFEHEEKKHPFHLVYWAEVRKSDGAEKFNQERP
jgi:hypothetical protein